MVSKIFYPPPPPPMTSTVVNSNVVILLFVAALTVYGFWFCAIDLSVLSSFAIILMRKRELIALLHCGVAVM